MLHYSLNSPAELRWKSSLFVQYTQRQEEQYILLRRSGLFFTDFSCWVLLIVNLKRPGPGFRVRFCPRGASPLHWQRGPGQRLVAVAVAVGRKGSKRSVVAAAGVMVMQRRRWIGMKLIMGAEGLAGLQAPSDELARKSGWR